MMYPWSQAHFLYSCLFVSQKDWEITYTQPRKQGVSRVMVVLAAALLAGAGAVAVAMYPKLAMGVDLEKFVSLGRKTV